ncbi:MAG TPA: hypothetical protein VFU19_11845 [Iamia sp.]|nr:hypothetical protein [Iamia sp.]
MKRRAIVRVLGTMALTTILALGVTAAPAQADPSDTQLTINTWSPQYNIGGCLYKVVWGTYYTIPFTRVHIYTPATCGTPLVAIEYLAQGGMQADSSLTVIGSGYDACGSYQIIQATGREPGWAGRGLVWLDGGLRWYSQYGQATQPIHSTC